MPLYIAPTELVAFFARVAIKIKLLRSKSGMCLDAQHPLIGGPLPFWA
jgi:hypothetical protein